MFLKLEICLAILAAVAHSCFALNAEWDQEWVKFIKTHHKVYRNKIEELHRRTIWEDNMKMIHEHNQNANATFSMKMNQFGDLTRKEFVRIHLRPLAPIKPEEGIKSAKNLNDIPDSVDWRSKGCVSPVINQGQCGASWAFGVASSMEGVVCGKVAELEILSAQQLLDCSQSFGNEGCEGGQIYETFEYIQKYGLESNESYPYTGDSQTCQYDASKVIVKCSGAKMIDFGDEDGLTAAVANIGPVAIAIDASQGSFAFYSGGLYYEPNCQSDVVDHGTVVVGYGSFGPNKDYYIVKNSWGTQWGDKGYIYMSRNRGNNCGIASQASYPIV